MGDADTITTTFFCSQIPSDIVPSKVESKPEGLEVTCMSIQSSILHFSDLT